MPEMRTCAREGCGKSFEARRLLNKKACSRACNNALWRQSRATLNKSHVTRMCALDGCKIEFNPGNNRGSWGRRYCCQSHQRLSRSCGYLPALRTCARDGCNKTFQERGRGPLAKKYCSPRCANCIPYEILSQPIKCANPKCDVEFIRRSGKQKYCHRNCIMEVFYSVPGRWEQKMASLREYKKSPEQRGKARERSRRNWWNKYRDDPVRREKNRQKCRDYKPISNEKRRDRNAAIAEAQLKLATVQLKNLAESAVND